MKKKVLSLMLAGVLFAGMSLNVAAEDDDPVDSTTTTVTTTGTVNYVDTTVYVVTLPTEGCFNFTIDPQGILSATEKETYTEEKYPNGTAGYIIASEGSGAYIKNESSVPIKLTVDAYVTSDDSEEATKGAPSSINLLGLNGLTSSGIDNNMMLSFDITGELEDGKMLEDETGIKTETVVPNVIAIEKNGAPADSTETGTQISFALNKATYTFGGNKNDGYTYLPDTESEGALPGDAVGMRLSGFVNTNADWSDYAGEGAEPIIVKTTFSFDKLSSDYEVAALDGRAHGVLADVDAAYFAGLEYSEENEAYTDQPATGEMEYGIGQGALIIPFDLGAGTKELTVTDVSVKSGDALDVADYKVSNGLITLKSTEASVVAAFAAVVGEANPEGTVIPVAISTSDGKTTTVNVRMYGA